MTAVRARVLPSGDDLVDHGAVALVGHRPKAGGLEADQELLDETLSRCEGRIVAIEREVAGAYERLRAT